MRHPIASYQAYPPSGDLAPFIDCYAALKFQSTREKINTDSFFPFGRPYLVIKVQGLIRAKYSPFKRSGFSSDHIAGQLLHYSDYQHSGDLSMIGIFFHPSGLNRLYGIPMNSLTNNTIDLDHFLGYQGEELIERISLSNSTKQRIDLLSSTLRKQLKNKKIAEDVTEEAVRLICHDSCKSIDEVSEYLKVSSRYLRRKFREKIGIGPKCYLRLCRFHKALELSRKHPGMSLLDLTYCCGYYDQSHFCKDFRQFSGTTPAEFLRKNNQNYELGNIIA